MLICVQCGNEFKKPNDNRRRKYCSKECSAKASNIATKRRYEEKKNKTNKKCLGCDATLSRYNENKYCALCLEKNRNNKDRDMSGIKWL